MDSLSGARITDGMKLFARIQLKLVLPVLFGLAAVGTGAGVALAGHNAAPMQAATSSAPTVTLLNDMEFPSRLGAARPADDAFPVGTKPPTAAVAGGLQNKRLFGLLAGGGQAKAVGAIGHLARGIEPDLSWQRRVGRPVIGQGDRPNLGALRWHEHGMQPGQR